MGQAMLPFLAVAGHSNLAKSMHLYLQNIHYGEGYHVIRRSDRYWVGLSADMIIEQALVWSPKTIGGLTGKLCNARTY